MLLMMLIIYKMKKHHVKKMLKINNEENDLNSFAFFQYQLGVIDMHVKTKVKKYLRGP